MTLFPTKKIAISLACILRPAFFLGDYGDYVQALRLRGLGAVKLGELMREDTPEEPRKHFQNTSGLPERQAYAQVL